MKVLLILPKRDYISDYVCVFFLPEYWDPCAVLIVTFPQHNGGGWTKMENITIENIQLCIMGTEGTSELFLPMGSYSDYDLRIATFPGMLSLNAPPSYMVEMAYGAHEL